MPLSRFAPSRLDGVEDLESYQPGGLHPITLHQTLAQGCYRIIHKLGSGGSSTIWLGRGSSGKLVTIKAMRAGILANPEESVPELSIPKKVLEYIHENRPSTRANIQVVDDYFKENGPNGSHLFLVTPFAGPSVRSMLDCPGRVEGSRRLRRDLAIKVARQIACAVQLTHAAGFVHGDITTSNVLFQFNDGVKNWSDHTVYEKFGYPNTEETATRIQFDPGPHLPAHLIEPIETACLTNPEFLREDTLLIDFGQSFFSLSPPPDYEPATVLHYSPPESRFEGKISMGADVWGLACTIFEIRAGFPLFESFFGQTDEILKEMVATLGRLPDPWWSAFENRHMWFDDDGRPKAKDLQRVLVPAEEMSIEHKLASIGAQDEPPASGDNGPMMEPLGTRLEKAEVDLLADLLRKMLRYRPEDRINMSEVVSHPWFALEK